MSKPFPFRLNGRRYVIATAQASSPHARATVPDARGRRWLDVQIRRRGDDAFLTTDRAFVDANGRILAMTSALGFQAWGDVDARRVAARHRGRGHDFSLKSTARRPPEWDAIARYELLWLERQEQLQLAVRRGELQPHEVPAPYRAVDFPRLPADRSFAQLLAEWPL